MRFGARAVHRPTTLAEVQQVVSDATGPLRVLGTGHCFNTIVDTEGDLVSLAAYPSDPQLSADGTEVSVGAGARYGELGAWLHERGYGLANLASLPHINVVGACMTGTHGSGIGLGGLQTAVTGLETVLPDGSIEQQSRGADGERFLASVVALGRLGVVTRVTLAIEPTYDVRQYVFDHLPRRRLAGDLDEIVAAGTSVSFFTLWDPDVVDQVWVKRRVDRADGWEPQQRWLDATLADGARHPIRAVDPVHCTEQGGVAGPWHERLPHFRLGFTPSVGEELQTEYLLPREHLLPAIEAVEGLRDRIRPLLQISEIRWIAGDDLWLSPSYGRDSVALHFTWRRDVAAVSALLPSLEAALAAYEPRPHWGKLFAMDGPGLAQAYPRLGDFASLVRQVDPAGRLANPFTDAALAAV